MSNVGDPTTPEEIVSVLRDEDGVAKACETVERWTKEERVRDLVALAAALEERCDPSDSLTRSWFEAVADHVEDQLALTPGDAAIDALLALSLRTRERSASVPRTRALRVRAFASRLGYGQTKEAFLSLLDRAGQAAEHQELIACWMHEIVLRGVPLENEPRAERFRQGLVKSKHPLAGLPLALRLAEREVPTYMPLYGDKGLGRAIEALTSGPMSVRPTVPPPEGGASVEATELTEAALTDRLRAAVRPWGDGKSGKVEAKVFALAPAVESRALGSWLLRTLPLESGAGARLEVARIGVEAVFGPLFSAASNGGAYSSGLGGAYGRLAAWTSLGALVGADAEATSAEVESLGALSTFLTFRASGPWFHDVAWDLGVVALRPDGLTVAIVAATDAE